MIGSSSTSPFGAFLVSERALPRRGDCVNTEISKPAGNLIFSIGRFTAFEFEGPGELACFSGVGAGAVSGAPTAPGAMVGAFAGASAAPLGPKSDPTITQASASFTQEENIMVKGQLEEVLPDMLNALCHMLTEVKVA
jgi:hypothetical protein